MMQKKFSYEVKDNGEGYIPFNPNATEPAKIIMKTNARGQFWLSANPAGYLHLAKIFAELGMREFDGGYHLHMDATFKQNAITQEFNFGLLE